MKIKNKMMIFITIMILIVILFTSSGVIANSDISSLKTGNGKNKIGQVLSLGFNDTLNKSGDNGAYCIQKGKSLHSERRNYTVSAYVEINGNLATVYNSKDSSEGKLIIDNLNGQVAYILSKNQGYGEVNNNTEAQKALWHIVNRWTKSLFGTSEYTCSNNANVSENELNRKAIEYANKVGGDVAPTEEEKNAATQKVVDKTNKDELSVSIEDEYFRVGPFRWEFGGTLESITVKGDNRELSSSDVRFVKYSGTTANIVKASEISTGEAFYVDIDNDAGVSKLTGLTLKTSLDTPSKQIYTARIWFLTSAAYQNIIYVDIGSSKSTPSVGEGSYDVETSIDLQLKKVDDRDTTKPLVGVGFTFSTTIQTYDKVGEQEHYKNVSCTHKIKDAYKDANGVEHEAEYQHSYDTVLDWTQYKYEWTDHTMYLNDNTWSKDSSTYLTDKDGLISIKNIKFPTKTIKNESSKGESYTSTARLKAGEDIIATEVSNPYYGYTIGNTYKIALESGKQIENKIITNHQKLVKLSGYVWIDSNSGKLTMRQEEFEAGEKGKDGIKVYLRDRNGTPVKEDTTREQNLYSEIQGGEYQFTDIDLDALQRGDYYVEFEYCGIYYQSVSPNLNINNGSKAIDTSTRNVLDSKFAYVNASGNNTLQIRDVTVDYKNADEHVKEINYCAGCNVYARTNEAGYNLYSGFTPTSEEIRYVNLGLYEKPQTDYALAQDLHNVSVSVNGKSHIYKYAKARFANDGNNINENDTTWNVGVKFQNNNGTYNRAIYHTDAWYEDQNKSNEIKVRVTYKVALKNESTYLGRINSIVDYCDNRYTLIKAGTSIDDKYNIGGNISFGNKTNYNNEYAKYIIDVNSIIKPTETNYIYLQFEIDRAGVLSIMNNKDLFNNVTEINSYTTFKDNNINTPVAVIDKDSVPGNIVPGQIKTYEDDTDAARSLKLELKNARAIEGTVFVDNPLNINKDSLNTGKERKGNGILDNGETKLSGIKVTLRNTNNQPVQIYDEAEGKWKEASAVTDNDGNFKISGYLPGNYILTYTWGNKDYRVQYYKGTIYDENRNQSNKFWYKEDTNTRKTDALDDSKIRKEIETEMKGITTNILETEINKAYNGESSKITKTSMDSSTPEMEFSVEYETTVTDGTLEKVEFIVNNIDFGIIERPIQQLELSKRVSAFKITLANGQVLADATITKDGKLEGLHNNTIYMGPTSQNSGMVKVEVDNELIQGATLETTYIMEVTNVGELDYTSDRYYYYGNSTGAELVTVSVTGLIDYVDGRLSIIDNNDGVWVEKDANYLINEVTVSEKDNETYINSNRAYLTEKLSKDLKPGDSNEVSLRTSKLLTSTDDNTFNNKSEIVKANKNDGFSIGTPVKVFETVGKINQFHFNVNDAESVIIVPSTGEDKSYVIPTIIGITSLLVLGVGIFVIKKFMVDNE